MGEHKDEDGIEGEEGDELTLALVYRCDEAHHDHAIDHQTEGQCDDKIDVLFRLYLIGDACAHCGGGFGGRLMTCASNIVNGGHGKKEGNFRCEGFYSSQGYGAHVLLRSAQHLWEVPFGRFGILQRVDWEH
jgi:hypothetical protein